MTIRIEPLNDAEAKSALCRKITAELPMWFGRPESNAFYASGIATRPAFVAILDQKPCGLMALEYLFAKACNVWWLGVSPNVHRRGVGRALLAHAAQEALRHGCTHQIVETLSPRVESPEYDITRRFYESVGFVPLVEFEPEPDDWMLWMVRGL